MVITAGHCLPEGMKAGDSCLGLLDFQNFELDRENSQSGTVPTTFHCQEIVKAVENGEEDVAVLKLKGVPKEVLEMAFEGIPDNSTLEVISYPENRQLSTSGQCADLGMDNGKRRFHNCDTTEGSSGAPVLLNGFVIGVHNRGSRYLQKNGYTSLREALEKYFFLEDGGEVKPPSFFSVER